MDKARYAKLLEAALNRHYVPEVVVKNGKEAKRLRFNRSLFGKYIKIRGIPMAFLVNAAPWRYDDHSAFYTHNIPASSNQPYYEIEWVKEEWQLTPEDRMILVKTQKHKLRPTGKRLLPMDEALSRSYKPNFSGNISLPPVLIGTRIKLKGIPLRNPLGLLVTSREIRIPQEYLINEISDFPYIKIEWVKKNDNESIHPARKPTIKRLEDMTIADITNRTLAGQEPKWHHLSDMSEKTKEQEIVRIIPDWFD